MPYTHLDPYGAGIIYPRAQVTNEHKNIEFTAVVKPKGGKITVKCSAFMRIFPSPWDEWILIKVVAYQVTDGLYIETYYSPKPFTFNDEFINNDIADLRLLRAKVSKRKDTAGIGLIKLRGKMEVAYLSCYEIDPPSKPRPNTVEHTIEIKEGQNLGKRIA